MVDVEASGTEERAPSLRRPLITWAVGLPICGVLAYLAASAGVQPGPPGIEDHGQVPTLGAMAWPFVAVVLIWGVAVFFVPLLKRVRGRDHGAPGFRIAHTWAGLACLALPILAMSGCTLYFSASPGCGEPRSGLLKPLPPGVDVIEADYGEPISGPQKWRAVKVVSDSASPDELFQLLVEHYRDRGWPVRPADDRRYASALVDDGWWLSIQALGQYDYQEGPPDAVRISLNHTPTDDRGCINW